MIISFIKAINAVFNCIITRKQMRELAVDKLTTTLSSTAVRMTSTSGNKSLLVNAEPWKMKPKTYRLAAFFQMSVSMYY